MSNRKIALIFIGTAKYADFFPLWHGCVSTYLMPEEDKIAVAFTDRYEEEMFHKPGVFQVPLEHKQWPYITLLRFAFINEILPQLKDKDVTHLLFLDADLFPQQKISFEDIFGDETKPFVGVHHPGNFDNPDWEAFIVEGDSNANILKMTSETKETLKGKVYHQGCLWGGEFSAVQEMCAELTRAIHEDLQNNIVADWHDESHMNRWFIQNYDRVRTIGTEYAFPDQLFWHKTLSQRGLSPKMLHVDKKHSDFPRFMGGSPELDENVAAHVEKAFAEKGISLPLTCDYCGKVDNRKPTQQSLAEWFLSGDGCTPEEKNEIQTTGKWKLACEACHKKYYKKIVTTW